MNVYDLLGVSCMASDEEISKAFKKLAMENHPDHGGDPAKMAELTAAYNKIKTPELRKKYDSDNAFTATYKTWETIFGRPDVAAKFGKKPTDGLRAVNGSNINLTVNIPMRVFCIGVYGMELKFKQQVPCLACSGTGAKKFCKCAHCGGTGVIRSNRKKTVCPECHGSSIRQLEPCEECGGQGFHVKDGSFIMPAYNRFTETYMVKGKGNGGKYGGQNGDLVVTFVPAKDGNVTWDPKAKRFLAKNVKVNIEDIVLGGEVPITIGTITRYVKIPPYPDGNIVDGQWCGQNIRLLLRVKHEKNTAVFEELRNKRKKN